MSHVTKAHVALSNLRSGRATQTVLWVYAHTDNLLPDQYHVVTIPIQDTWLVRHLTLT